MSRSVLILSVAGMVITVLAMVNVAFADENEGGPGEHMVTPCHKGHTITVGTPARAAHESHGDTEGACETEAPETPGVVTPPDTTTPDATVPDTTTPDTTVPDTTPPDLITPDTTVPDTTTPDTTVPYTPPYTTTPDTTVPDTTTADRVVAISCGQDLDAIVNADDPTIATRFQLEGGCTYPVDTTVLLDEGDEIAGTQGMFIVRGPAFDPEPTVTIMGSEGLSNVIRARGTVRLEWVTIVGGTGQYSSGGSPEAGTGSGLAMGQASDASSLYAVRITGSDAAGITNAHGTFDRVELDDTTQDPNFLGFTGSGLKAITEIEVRNSYVHDNQGNGLWCDQFCRDSASHPNGFWVHDNLVVNNGRAGIRFERVGDVADAGEALVENNEVHGNSFGEVRGGVSIHDAQNALVRGNVFGATVVAGVAYLPNSGGVAIRATDSGRADRPDLWNADIVDNVLNGEVIKGCESPDEIVYCFEETVSTVSSNGTAAGLPTLP